MRACTACLFERRWESLGKSPPKVSKRAKSPPKVCPKCVQREGQEKEKSGRGLPQKRTTNREGMARSRTQRVRPELVRKTEPQTEGTARAEHRGYGRSQMSHQRAHLRHAKRLRANHSHKRRLWTLWRTCGCRAHLRLNHGGNDGDNDERGKRHLQGSFASQPRRQRRRQRLRRKTHLQG